MTIRGLDEWITREPDPVTFCDGVDGEGCDREFESAMDGAFWLVDDRGSYDRVVCPECQSQQAEIDLTRKNRKDHAKP